MIAHGMCFLAGNHCWQRKNNDSKHHPLFESSRLLFELNQHDRVISSLVLINTHIYVNERITDMMSAGPFVAGLKCSGNIFGDSGLHLITLHNILEYMQIAIIQTEAVDFVKINICVILKTFGHDCTCLYTGWVPARLGAKHYLERYREE